MSTGVDGCDAAAESGEDMVLAAAAAGDGEGTGDGDGEAAGST